MTDIVALQERVARAIDPSTWKNIDQMTAMGRDAPYLRKVAETSLAAAARVVDILIEAGLQAIVEEVLDETVADGVDVDMVFGGGANLLTVTDGRGLIEIASAASVDSLIDKLRRFGAIVWPDSPRAAAS